MDEEDRKKYSKTPVGAGGSKKVRESTMGEEASGVHVSAAMGEQTPVKRLDTQLNELCNQVFTPLTPMSVPTRVNQAKAENLRASIHVINVENRKTTEDFEKTFRELIESHREDMKHKVARFQETIEELKKERNTARKEADESSQLRLNINRITGRLEECRTAKAKLEEELVNIKNKYEERIADLEHRFCCAKAELQKLQVDNDRNIFEVDKKERLEKCLEETKESLQNANHRIEILEAEIENKKAYVETLDQEKRKVEASLEICKEEIIATRKQLDDYVSKSKSEVESESSAYEMLKEDLTKAINERARLEVKLAEEEARSSDLELQVKDTHKQFQLSKADARILKRSVEEKDRQLSEKEDQYAKLKEKLSTLEAENCDLNVKVDELESSLASLNTKIDEQKKEYEALAALSKVLTEEKEQLQNDKITLQQEIITLNNRLEDHEAVRAALAGMEQNVQELEQTIQARDAELVMRTGQLETAQGTMRSYQKVMLDLDKQMDDMMNERRENLEKLEGCEQIKQLLETENRDIREQLRQVKIELNEAKSLKAFTEKRLAITESDLRTQCELKEGEYHSIMEKLAVSSSRNEELSRELSSLTTLVSTLEGEKFELRKSLEVAKNETERAKNESGRMLKIYLDSQDENVKLKSTVSETVSRADAFKRKWEAALDKLSMLEETVKLNELTYATKFEQQEKLIDHLCQQLATHEKKKKTFGIFTPKKSDKDFTNSSKTTTPHNRFKERIMKHSSKVHPMTPIALEEEKLMVEHLEQKKEDLRNKLQNLQSIGTPLSKKTPTLPTPRKEESVLLKERSNTIAGAHSRIETGRAHKYMETRCDAAKKCMACWEPIHKARPISECQECKYVFHLACSLSAGKTCGLSEKKAYEIEKDMSSRRAEPITNGADKDIRGFVKVRSEKMVVAGHKFLVIEDSKLKMYANEADRKTAQPEAIFPLNEKTTVFLRIDKTENEISGNEETTFAIKVSFYNEEGQSTYLYMFHTNKRQKRYWTQGILKYTKLGAAFSADNSFASDSSYSGDENKENLAVKVNEKVLVDEKEPFSVSIYVNCAHYIPDSRTYLLGCDEGLYSVRDIGSKPVKIAGPSSINGIDVLKGAKLGVFIEGRERVLSTSYSGLLKACSEAAECSSPTLKTKVVPHSKDCYMFASRSDTFDDTFVAAACTKGLLLCTLIDGNLVVIKQFLMKDIVTCLLITPQTVIFGNNKVYELDTKTFQVEEFLDSSDDAVLYVQIINEAHSSYPVAILDVSESQGMETKEAEYLVCFPDIGIFVDSFGRRSRDGDVLWSHVPVAFEYRHPFLYIVHFTSVEVQKLDHKSYKKVIVTQDKTKNRLESRVVTPQIRFFPVNSKGSPNFVGEGAQGIVIALHETEGIKVMELFPS